MDITALITGFLGGGVGTIIVNYFSKNLDYKYDYKKYILKKRQKAYDEVESVLAIISKKWTHNVTHVSTYAIFLDVDNPNKLAKFTHTINDIISQNSVWLSNEIIFRLRVVNQVLVDIYMQDPDFGKLTYEAVFDICVHYHDAMDKASQDFYNTFFNDVKNLENIKDFTVKKKKLYDP